MPIAYTITMKETYEIMKILLDKIQYDKYCSAICRDLKFIALLMGFQQLNFVVFVRRGQKGQEKSSYQEGISEA